MSSSDAVDVVVVGGGFSGLAAANKLVAGGKSVVVLEARDRVGGKVYDIPLPGGGCIETGAEFIGPYQHRVLELATELGVETFRTFDNGSKVFYMDGKRTLYNDKDGETIPIPGDQLMQLAQVHTNLDAMAAELDVYAPWEHPKALIWDRMTLSSWFDSCGMASAPRLVMDLTTRAILSAEPADMSLLQCLIYIGRAGDDKVKGTLQRVCAVEGGGQETRFKEGPQSIAKRLAERLGKTVKLSSPVRDIVQVGEKYLVSGETFTVKGRHVILALAPTLAARICYKPMLPTRRDKLCQHMPMGSVSKVVAVYKTPFWREEGLSGLAIGLDGVSVQCCFDTSPMDGSRGALLGFLEADEAHRMNHMSEKEIAAIVVEDFVKYYGEKARDVEHWVIQRWDNEEFSRGGHLGICPPNVLTQYGPAITEPVGNIYFAGTEAAPYWSGFMEGAIQAGEIAASRILQSAVSKGPSSKARI